MDIKIKKDGAIVENENWEITIPNGYNKNEIFVMVKDKNSGAYECRNYTVTKSGFYRLESAEKTSPVADFIGKEIILKNDEVLSLAIKGCEALNLWSPEPLTEKELFELEYIKSHVIHRTIKIYLQKIGKPDSHIYVKKPCADFHFNEPKTVEKLNKILSEIYGGLKNE